MTDKFLPTKTAFYSTLLQWLKESDIPCWQTLLIILLSAGITAATIVAMPLVIGQLFTHALPEGNRLLLQELPLLMATLLLAASASNLANNYTLQRLRGQLALHLHGKLLARSMSDMSDHSGISSETITSRHFTAANNLLDYLSRLVNILSRDLLVVIGLTTVLLFLNQELALLSMAALTVVLLTWPLPGTDTGCQVTADVMEAKVVESIRNAIAHRHLIQLDHGSMQEILTIHHTLDQQHRASLKQMGRAVLTSMLMRLFLVSLMTMLLYYALQQIVIGKLAPGEMVTFVSALLILILPLKRLLTIKCLLKNNGIPFLSIAALIDAPHLLEESPPPESTTCRNAHTDPIRRLHGTVCFENVRFYCDANRTQLSSCLNFLVRPEERLAITDITPCSARTLCMMISGFTLPTTGRVILDEHDAGHIDPTIRQINIAWLSPDRKLLSDTVAANIAYGIKRCSTETEITRAAHASHSTEFIRELPRGHETRLGPQSIGMLTDSQRQRLLIARVLLKDPAIVIIDESIAQFNLDDPLLQQALLTLTSKRTTLILSTQPALLNLAQRHITL
ncbi:MAG: ABC transporter ATP-binding protein [Nitrosomonas sp.]|jgi:ABC-type multidrug transport system fused ATPase/permease subunit|nr:ABC transporter ATP-binding protein [Nitrosomonas sp.]